MVANPFAPIIHRQVVTRVRVPHARKVLGGIEHVCICQDDWHSSEGEA